VSFGYSNFGVPIAGVAGDHYAADHLQLQVIRIDPATGERQVIADDPKLSLALHVWV
jgi:hypothetical protein